MSSDFVSSTSITGKNVLKMSYIFSSHPHATFLTFHRHWDGDSDSVVETRFRGKSAMFSSSSSSSSPADSIGSVFTCTMAYAEGTVTAGGRWLWLPEMLLLLSGAACKASTRWGWICLRRAANISTGSSLLLPLLPDSRTVTHNDCVFVCCVWRFHSLEVIFCGSNFLAEIQCLLHDHHTKWQNCAAKITES